MKPTRNGLLLFLAVCLGPWLAIGQCFVPASGRPAQKGHIPAEALGRRSSDSKGDFLTDDEQNKLRDAQDPSARIEVYLGLEEDRLLKFENFRSNPSDPKKYDDGAYLDKLLGQYIDINDEMKNWIQDQYDHEGDMRKGLSALLDQGARQLNELRHIQQTPDAFASAYADSLHDAIDDLNDTLDGGTKALAGQTKKFGELKQEQKLDAREAKERIKQEKKEAKEEKKLRKREHNKGVPGEDDDNP